MHKLALAPLVAMLCFVALDAPRELDEAFRSPEATIASYWHRMIERRHGAALECFVGAPAPVTTGMLQLPELVELRCRDFRVSSHGRGVVDVAYDIEYRITLADSLARFATGDRLRFTRAGWKIERPLLDIASRR
jgi:hypothetical protein